MRQTARLVALLLAAATAALTAAATNPFGFLATDVVLDRTDLATLQRGEPVVKLSNGDNDHLGVFAAIRIETSGERLLDWASAIEVTLKGRYVPEIGRFGRTRHARSFAESFSSGRGPINRVAMRSRLRITMTTSPCRRHYPSGGS